jgi:hypothetical protein
MLQILGAWRILRAPLVVGAVGSAVWMEAADQFTNSSLSGVETNAGTLQLQLEELKLAFRKIVADNAELKLQIADKEKTAQLLTQDLTVWKTEAQLFQQKWEEAQLAAKASGAKLMSEGEQRLQKQLAESIRQLYETQQQRERLRDETQKLVELLVLVREKGDSLDPQVRRLVEVQLDSAANVLQSLKAEPAPDGTNQVASVAADAGRVLDVNRELQLVVLSLGRAHGVTIGMPFTVLRGDAVVAHVKVVDVREKISGALIDRMPRSARVEVGDMVKLDTDRK